MATAGKGPDTLTHQVFISYANHQEESSQSDRQVADRIYSTLESQGFRCWMAHRDIFPGEDWLNTIIDAVEASQVLVVVFSANSEESEWVKDEIKIALDNKITIIPFRIENVTPRKSLRILKVRCQFLDAFTMPLENHLEQLVKVVARHLGQEPGKPVTPKEEFPTIKVKTMAKDINAAKEESNEPADRPEHVKAVMPKAGKVKKNEKGYWEAYYQDEIVMIYIPPGEFMMGQTEEEKKWLIDQVGEKKYNSYYKRETPLHKVYLDGYWLGKYEVTFAQYDRYCEETAREEPDDSGWGRDKRPVVNVSRGDAAAYCQWLSQETGLEFKLPTEARWEKAARGTARRKYPWGSREPDKTLANFNSIIGKTTPVGSYPEGASPYGLLDMAGNVWEWCSDWFAHDYYKNSPPKNPQGPSDGADRVLRGGSWIFGARYLRRANRRDVRTSNRYSDVGFRLCQG